MDERNLYSIDTILLEDKFDCPKHNQTTKFHFHNAYELMLVHKANGTLVIRDRHFQLNSYTLVMIAPGVPHMINYKGGHEYHRTVLNFEPEFVQDVLAIVGCSEALNTLLQDGMTVIQSDLPVLSRANRIIAELTSRYKYYDGGIPQTVASLRLALASFLIDFITLTKTALKTTQNKSGERDVSKEKVTRILEYIDANFMNHISLEMLEDEFFLSKSYISRVFKRHTGVSIIEHLQIKRIFEAQKLLVEADTSVTDICFKCGFSNIQHFYRCFKKVTGLNPGTWKKEALIKDKEEKRYMP